MVTAATGDGSHPSLAVGATAELRNCSSPGPRMELVAVSVPACLRWHAGCFGRTHSGYVFIACLPWVSRDRVLHYLPYLSFCEVPKLFVKERREGKGEGGREGEGVS